MIDVPVPVKEALKDGFLKKNYRFVVEVDNWEISGHFETLYGFPDFLVEANKFVIIQDTNLYKFTIDSPNTNYTFYYYESGDWQILAPISTNTWIFAGTGDNTWCEICYTTGNRANITIEKHIDTLTIDNNNLVSESVNIDERMCSGDTIKFGLCEGSSLEFQYFGLENITGRRLQAFVDVQYPDYSDVTELNANSRITTVLYMSAEYVFTSWGHYRVIGTNSHLLDVWQIGQGTMHYVNFTTDSDGNKVVEFDVDLKNITKIRIRASQRDTTAKVQKYEYGGWYSIPLGFFDVKKCSRQASTGIIKAVCYNKLQSEYLDAKANEFLKDLSTDTDSEENISVWAVLKQLLQDYEIEEDDGTPVGPLYGQSNSLSQIDNGFQFKPVNESRNYYPYFGWKEKGFDVPAGKKLKISALSNFIEKVTNQIGELWEAIASHCQDPDTVRANIKSNTLFQMISGIAVGFYTYSGTVPNPHYELRPLLVKVSSDYISAGNSIVTNVYTPISLTRVNNQLKVIENLEDEIYLTNARHVCFCYVTKFGGTRSSTSFVDDVEIFRNETVSFEEDDFNALCYEPTDSERIVLPVSDITDITLRELASANYEMNCQYGQLSRITDLFSGVTLNRSRLYPADTLYPASNLYPGGAALSTNKSSYSQLWADEGNVHKWRYLIITYKGLDGEGNETDFTLQRTVNADGTDDYNCSDNWLFRNLVWTAAKVGQYADLMVSRMQGITWFPFELWGPGLPYLETGDEIEIPLGENSYTSYILQRQLKGIQNLQDTYINGTLDIF